MPIKGTGWGGPIDKFKPKETIETKEVVKQRPVNLLAKPVKVAEGNTIKRSTASC